MASQPTLSRGGQNAGHLQDMAANLLIMLGDHGVEAEGIKKALDELQEMLAKVATYVANPDIPVDDLLLLLEGARKPSSLRFGYPEAEALLQQILASLEEETKRALDAGIAIPRLRELLLVVAQQLDMVPLRDSEPVHMLDGDSNFCEESVAGMVKRSPQLSAPNAPYAVVSIVGAQSSGKSYLLNRLFGTKFPEMNAKYGRSQTTRGIMMSRCIGPSLLVLDIEGFDGREKGQDTLFEKQAALLALTISDIMLVNMNVFDIGREQAGGTLLFKTIFKERIKLDAGLTKILVVLRMYDGETPLEMLKDDVMSSLEKMWNGVNMDSQKFKDYIEVNVVGLPDKNSSNFPKEVTKLRRLLSNTTLDHNRSSKVPASGFSTSSKILWNTIKINKKLDIPSHQVAIARLFCRQTADDSLNNVKASEDYKLLKDEESPRNFKEISDRILGSIKIMYDEETEMYDTKERDNGRKYMVENLNKAFTEHSGHLIRKMRRKTIEQFKEEYDKISKTMEESDAELSYHDAIVYSFSEKFRKSCEDLKTFVSDNLQWICDVLEKDLQSYVHFKNLNIREIRWRKDLQRTGKNMEEVVKKLQEIANERQVLVDEMRRQNEKQLKDESEYTRKLLVELGMQNEKNHKIPKEQKKSTGCNIM